MLGFTEIEINGELHMLENCIYNAVRGKVLEEERRNAKTTDNSRNADGSSVGNSNDGHNVRNTADADEFRKAVELMEECDTEETEFVTDQYNLKDDDLEISIARTKYTGIEIEIVHGNTHRLLSL